METNLLTPVAENSAADAAITLPNPLRVMFMLTSVPVGGAETLLCNLMQRMDSRRFRPQLCCLKELGPLGKELAREFPATSQLLNSKYDVGVIRRLVTELKSVDALVTVGAGDKMFWGRIAARFAKTPVVLSALHSTGWPDGVGRLNRLLTPWTDGFIAVADDHGRFLVEHERFPKEKVFVIPNGIDTDRFVPQASTEVRAELGIPSTSPIVGIVAALRPEKNHAMFIRMAKRVVQRLPEAQFLIVGDGPERPSIESLIAREELSDNFHLLGSRSDIPRIVAAMDLFCLTSENEANPVSILEALACEVPVVATNVGSVSSTVIPEQTGLLVESNHDEHFANAVLRLLGDSELAKSLGRNGRSHVVRHASLASMVDGYENLIGQIYDAQHSRAR